MHEVYPFKFEPIYKEKIWGNQKLRTVLNKDIPGDKKIGESWEISAVQGDTSIVKNGYLAGNSLQELIEVYMADLVGEKIYETYGIEFPLLIKFIDATDVLSIQVHPDDELAKKRHKAFGKTEMWYVVQADEGAELISGFNQEMDKETYLKHLNNNTLPEILNNEKVKAGDVFYLPSGRVHAIGAGILLAEIQQTSDITYRIFDWNRMGADGKPRELHTDLALDAIDYKYYGKYRTDYEAEKNESANLVSCQYFTTNILEVDQEIEKDWITTDSFVIYMCLEGKAEFEYDEEDRVEIEAGETVLIPASIDHLKYIPRKYAKFLEVYIDTGQNNG
ncbi:MAG: type I phosphomannose isomerase catalytic subunit [Bacteroidota bacterium]